MSILSGKKILLGISGGIAAYKTAILVRLFIKNGAEVKVVMTPDAKEFITPLTLSTLSKNPVHSSFTSDDEDETWNNHVDLGMWADLILICPATANTLSKLNVRSAIKTWYTPVPKLFGSFDFNCGDLTLFCPKKSCLKLLITQIKSKPPKILTQGNSNI